MIRLCERAHPSVPAPQPRPPPSNPLVALAKSVPWSWVAHFAYRSGMYRTGDVELWFCCPFSVITMHQYCGLAMFHFDSFLRRAFRGCLRYLLNLRFFRNDKNMRPKCVFHSFVILFISVSATEMLC